MYSWAWCSSVSHSILPSFPEDQHPHGSTEVMLPLISFLLKMLSNKAVLQSRGDGDDGRNEMVAALPKAQRVHSMPCIQLVFCIFLLKKEHNSASRDPSLSLCCEPASLSLAASCGWLPTKRLLAAAPLRIALVLF